MVFLLFLPVFHVRNSVWLTYNKNTTKHQIFNRKKNNKSLQETIDRAETEPYKSVSGRAWGIPHPSLENFAFRKVLKKVKKPFKKEM